MSHDFAKKTKTTKKKTSPRRKSQVPGWVWLFTGIVTGVFVSFLAYLADITPERPAPNATSVTNSSSNQTQDTAQTENTTRFDFYTLLPELEVLVPDEAPEHMDEPAQATVFILQAGSFKNNTDADRLRANLILLGLDVKVEAATVASGDVWHRVLVGPFYDRSKLSKARSILIEQGINSLVYTLKDSSQG